MDKKRDIHRHGRTFRKSNSTGSLYLTSTLNAPDASELVKCMALMALRMMEESAKHPAPPKYPKKVYAVFDDPDVSAGDAPLSSLFASPHHRFPSSWPLLAAFRPPSSSRGSSKALSTPATLRRNRVSCL